MNSATVQYCIYYYVHFTISKYGGGGGVAKFSISKKGGRIKFFKIVPVWQVEGAGAQQYLLEPLFWGKKPFIITTDTGGREVTAYGLRVEGPRKKRKKVM
jgi:hypothetical protein